MNETLVDGFWTRDGTTDANAVFALVDDEYGLVNRKLTGWAIDVGAHIGTVALSMARWNPGLQVLAVEAVPENSDLLERNIARAGLPVTSVRAYAARPGDETGVIHYNYRGGRETEGDGYVDAHRFIGGTWRTLAQPEASVEMPAVSLDSLLETYQIDDVALLKIDCEGCEWAFLDTPAVAKVAVIVGEYHGGYSDLPDYEPFPARRIRELLEPTHDVTFSLEDPAIGLFEAVRR